jgi:hypothetical protein
MDCAQLTKNTRVLSTVAGIKPSNRTREVVMNTKQVFTAKILSVAALATAFAFAPTAKAQVAFGVQIGRPNYVRVEPRYPVAPIIVDPYRRYDYDRHDVYLRDQWQRDRDIRAHAYYDRRFDNHRGW